MLNRSKRFLIKILILVFALGFFAAGGLLVWAVSLPIPDFDYFFEQRVVAQSAKIYDRTGEVLLYDAHENIRRSIVPFDEISDHIKNATISIEDRNFYNHNGVQFSAILRAFIINITTGTIEQGGSTITQQVIKNTLLTQEKKISRKIKEFVLALKIERSISKDEILNLYLNESPYGGNIYGIEEASRFFFGKNAKDIGIAEAAYLASLPQAPTFLSPYGNNIDRLESRKNTVLREMRNNDFISEDEYKEAIEEEVVFVKPTSQGILAPHFVFYILSELEKDFSEDEIRNGGFEIITTLDYKAQKLAEESITAFAERNKEQFNAGNAGMVVIDPKNGHILAMVGSVDYFDRENDGNFNITLAKRQPGSSFKPFVYASALEEGYTPETVVFDLPTEFSTSCNPDGTKKTPEAVCYSPVNFDDVFVGPITFREALAQSRNIPAVKVLYLTGINNAIKLAERFGITTLTEPSRYGLTLVLGGAEVTPLELTSAYSVFANDGLRNNHTGIISIKNGDNIIYEFSKNEQRVIDENIARQISDILSDNSARTPTFGENSLLRIPGFDVAVKTGTTNDYRDAWTVGYTPNVAVGVWVGNNDNTSMEKKIAGLIVTPIWNKFITEYLVEVGSNEVFKNPNPTPKEYPPILRGYWMGNINYFIDKISGGLATEFTPPELIEEKIVTSVHSVLYWINKDNPLGPKPSNPDRDPQFNLWETPVRKWALGQGIIDQSTSVIPDFEDPIHTEDSKPIIRTNSLNKDSYKKDERIDIVVNSNKQIDQIDFFINNIFIGTVKNSNIFFITPENIEGIQEDNVLKIVVYDKNRNSSSIEKSFSVLD